ncbi:MAG: hypothetical protein K2X27_09775 [Candidatus Obscuribacterales bacterium]|nr:hypothetical protein [Candidatus Obscuribacterales bacterium]
MITARNKVRKNSSRSKCGATLLEFAAALSLFFCCLFVPLIDIAFIPVRYLLAYNNLDTVVHHMSLFEKRSQALQFLHADLSWKKQLESCGVTVKNVKASLIVCDPAGSSKLTLAEGAKVPSRLLPSAVKSAGVGCTYALELSTTVDIPPLFDSHVGLPGFSKAIEFKISSRAQWENLSPDPYTTGDSKSVQYYINE